LRCILELREKVFTMTHQPHASTAEDIEQVHVAARELYEAELALHDAHQTRVDAWIAAAADHLHRAVVRYESALAAAAHSTPYRSLCEHAVPA
jgi:hypothetical protein